MTGRPTTDSDRAVPVPAARIVFSSADRAEIAERIDGTLRTGALTLGPATREFEAEYRAALATVLAEAKLEAPADQRAILGGRRGHHSEHLGHLLSELQSLQRSFPGATW